VDNGGTDTCWFVVTDDGRLGFATSFFGEGRISSYEIGEDGDLTLLNGDAAGALGIGASDIALSGSSDFLYQLNSFEGTINAFEVATDGGLTLIQTVQAHEPSEMAARLGIAAF
jgi:6-phosphogluconolactonase (cycloisomerase 2 family)